MMAVARRVGPAAGVSAVLAAVLLVTVAAPARSDDPVTSAVRFNREIIRIFDRKCLPCHAAGTIAMPLATYRDARPWARAIREEIVEQRMPPWSAARGSVRFTDDIGLTPRELTTILTWLDGGLPKGDDADLPAPVHANVQDLADLTLPLPPQSLPGSGADLVRRVTISAGLSGDRWVRQVRIAPGDRRLVRAAFASIVSAAPRGDAGAGGREPVWVGAWTPWQPVISPPEDGAFLLPAGSRIEVELHYRGADAPAVDRSTVHIRFAEARQRTPGATLAIHAVHRAAPGRWRGARTLPRAATIWALRPEGVEGRSLEVTAYSTDGRVQVLLWIPRFRADWPAPFVLAKPVTLDAGTVVRVIAEGPRPTAGALLAIAE